MKMKVTENENEELNVCNDIMETDMKKTEFKKKNKQNHNLICACPI